MSKWIIDPDHSVGAFAIRHLMISYVHGQINKVSGMINFDAADITSLSVELEMDVSGMMTGIVKRDDHLKSHEFFDVEKFPKIIFRSKSSERTGFHSLKVSGDITVHGITRPMNIDIYISGPVKSPFGETCIGLTGKTKLNREDFGIIWNVPLEKGGLMVGKDVEISVNIEADLKEE